MKSTWHGLPSKAHWYCEVVFREPSGETDYNYGYSEAVEEPDPDTVWDLVPEGYTLLESSVTATPRVEATI